MFRHLLFCFCFVFYFVYYLYYSAKMPVINKNQHFKILINYMNDECNLITYRLIVVVCNNLRNLFLRVLLVNESQ